jgi:hypothetical protein
MQTYEMEIRTVVQVHATSDDHAARIGATLMGWITDTLPDVPHNAADVSDTSIERGPVMVADRETL